MKSLFRYCTSNGCNIEDGSIYSDGNLDPLQTEPLETETEEEPALVIDFGPDEPADSSCFIITQSLIMIVSLLVYL